MTVKQVIVGVAAAGITVALLIHRLPERKSSVKVAKLETSKPSKTLHPSG